MNALEKRDSILKALSTRPDSLAILARYGVSRTDIGRNAANFAACRDAMFAELCGDEPMTMGEVASAEIAAQDIASPIPSAPMHSTRPVAHSSAPAGVDALKGQLQSILASLSSLSTPAPAPMGEVDLSGIQAQIDDLDSRCNEGFSTAQDEIEKVKAEMAAIQTALVSAPASVKHAAGMAVAKVAGGMSPACTLMAKLVPPHGNHTASAIMLVGGSGTGKSFDAELHARAFDYATAPFACSPMTEPYELFGAVTQTTAGLAFVDGCVSAAMRHASNGESSCIILDELPRLSDNVKMTLLTLLTARIARDGKHSGKRVFSLRTGNAILSATGVWEPEVIDAPVESIAFIATGNIGEQFNVRSGGIDEAVWKRFTHLRVNWDAAIALGIFERSLDAAGFDKTIASKVLLPFVEKTREMAEHESLAYPACIRTVTRAIAHVSGGTKKELRKELEALCEHSFCGWEHNGATTPANLDAVKSMIHPLLSPLA